MKLLLKSIGELAGVILSMDLKLNQTLKLVSMLVNVLGIKYNVIKAFQNLKKETASNRYTRTRKMNGGIHTQLRQETVTL